MAARIIAFTLIELLTVISTIALLAGLLLAALSAAKARAYTSRCASNFRQFALALQLYAHDHDDRLPRPNLAPSTVHTHVQRLYRKLRVHSRGEALMRVFRQRNGGGLSR